MKIIAKNKRAHFDFFLKELFEAGLVLQGTEVKVLREGQVTISEAYVSIDQNFEAWLHNLIIPHYGHGNRYNHREDRKRKLLLHKKETEEILKRSKAEGLTIVPTKIYFKKSNVKVQIALAKGKKFFDKREDQKKKDVERKLRQGQYE